MVQLSQTMLGDTIDKTKNPLKKAMRRRTEKRVTFTAPTYVEPSDYEFSSDEDTGDDISPPNGNSRSGEEQNAEDGDQDEITTVAPLSIKQGKRDISPEKRASGEEDRRRTISEDLRSSDELFDRECKSFEIKHDLQLLIIFQSTERNSPGMVPSETLILSFETRASRRERSHSRQTYSAMTQAQLPADHLTIVDRALNSLRRNCEATESQ